MNTTANFQVFPTPYAFCGKKCKQGKQRKYVLQNMETLINIDKKKKVDNLLLDKLKKYLIQSTFNIRIEGEFPYSDIDIKDFFSYMGGYVNNGMVKTNAIHDFVRQRFDI